MPGTIAPVRPRQERELGLAERPAASPTTSRACCRAPLRFANDANCFALSEAIDGAAAGAAVVFGVIVGTGTGGGIALDGRAWGGPERRRRRVGPQPAALAARRRAAGPALLLRALRLPRDVPVGPGPRARPRARRPARARPRRRSPSARPRATRRRAATLERFCDRLARGLATVVNLLDPDVIVLGGGLSKIALLYDARARAAAALRLLGHGRHAGAPARPRRLLGRPRRRAPVVVGSVERTAAGAQRKCIRGRCRYCVRTEPSVALACDRRLPRDSFTLHGVGSVSSAEAPRRPAPLVVDVIAWEGWRGQHRLHRRTSRLALASHAPSDLAQPEAAAWSGHPSRCVLEKCPLQVHHARSELRSNCQANAATVTGALASWWPPLHGRGRHRLAIRRPRGARLVARRHQLGFADAYAWPDARGINQTHSRRPGQRRHRTRLCPGRGARLDREVACPRSCSSRRMRGFLQLSAPRTPSRGDSAAASAFTIQLTCAGHRLRRRSRPLLPD